MNQVICRFSFYIAMLACLCFGMPDGAFAAVAEAGMVANMEGSLAAKGADGTLRALAAGGKVFAGDMLFTSKDSYARIKFADGGMMSLRPNSQFRIEGYNYDEKQPGQDSAVFNLVKGGMRAISGSIGHRGDPDSYAVKTHTATIGIRGTNYGVQLCQGDCADIPTPDGVPPEDGLHVDVTGGVVLVKNAAGAQLLNAGQFAYVKDSSSAPVVVPSEQGIRVEIPARISIDKVKGNNQGDGGTGGATGGANPTKPTPNVCPAP